MQNKVVLFRNARKGQRDRVSGYGELTWDSGCASNHAVVQVSNLSDNGVQVVASTPIPVGVPAYLTGEEFRCIGTVRYCKQGKQGFRIGLEFGSEPNQKNAIVG